MFPVALTLIYMFFSIKESVHKNVLNNNGVTSWRCGKEHSRFPSWWSWILPFFGVFNTQHWSIFSIFVSYGFFHTMNQDSKRKRTFPKDPSPTSGWILSDPRKRDQNRCQVWEFCPKLGKEKILCTITSFFLPLEHLLETHSLALKSTFHWEANTILSLTVNKLTTLRIQKAWSLELGRIF